MAQRDSTGRLVREWRGPKGAVAKCMHPRHAERCAACNHPMPITPNDIALVVKTDKWRLYHLDAACRPEWVTL